ncbi:MAG: glycoside hydrolase family 31 protein [Lachnospiraceae bacterium]|nr:glycoside hydrolase family 31 protein [Lachnospiraceae bacterium]
MEKYGTDPSAKADPRAVVDGKNYRFTVLTERMVRMEYSPDGIFVDEATQTVLHRQFPVPEYRVRDKGTTIEICTDCLIVTYEKNCPFTGNTLSVQMMNNPYLRKSGTWFYGDDGLESRGNLKGTASTLDNAVGDWYYGDAKEESHVWGDPEAPVELCSGLMSMNGFAVIDDSKSLVFDVDGWVHPAPEGHQDLYFLNYGRDYLKILDVFYQMTGKTPMLPRYALGNWWSRFYKYTQEEYLKLLERFRDEKIPVAVSVLDMDWHTVDIDPKYGKGWTGYTWNRELFPDPEAMMKEIHDQGMHFSLNVHPADGVRAHEEMYEEMAKELGVNYEEETPIPFDVTDPKFMKAYFTYLHHPQEEKGVDFWWIDWQQGSNSKVPGYDPLWMLNHYHYLDNARNGLRPMDFSRFAGLGSHRYPIGFSGSTFITWESLDFQPYFTANASNVGYGWWSHDIGGHRNGYRDDELTTRWVQFGVFSPIMRLHSSDEVFTGKEPWKFCADSERVMRRFLTLRHELLPYIYTMNYRFHADNLPLICPMYYYNPENREAYQHKNEYYFGTELIVHPITSKTDSETRMGSVKTWLPEGTWIDFFTGMIYQGNRTIRMHRSIDTIPVLAKAGAIVPMQPGEDVSSRTDNPARMLIKVFGGADGAFELYEDDGITNEFEQGAFVTTKYQLNWSDEKSFIIEAAEGKTELIPARRDYRVEFYGIGKNSLSEVFVDDCPVVSRKNWDADRHILSVEIEGVDVSQKVIIRLASETDLLENNVCNYAYEAINQAQIPFAEKENVYRIVTGNGSRENRISSMEAMYMPDEMKHVLCEILLA